MGYDLLGTTPEACSMVINLGSCNVECGSPSPPRACINGRGAADGYAVSTDVEIGFRV